MITNHILRDCEGIRATMMGTIISFLKTEVARGKHGAEDALNTLTATVQGDPMWTSLGKGIIDKIVHAEGFVVSLNSNGIPAAGSTGVTNLVNWVVKL